MQNILNCIYKIHIQILRFTMSDQQNNQQHISQDSNGPQLSSAPSMNGYTSPYVDQFTQGQVFNQGYPVTPNSQFTPTPRQIQQSQQPQQPQYSQQSGQTQRAQQGVYTELSLTNNQDLMSYISTQDNAVTGTIDPNNPYISSSQTVDIPQNLEELLLNSSSELSQQIPQNVSVNSPIQDDNNQQTIGYPMTPPVFNLTENAVYPDSQQTNSSLEFTINNSINPTADITQNSGVPTVHSVLPPTFSQKIDKSLTNANSSNSSSENPVSEKPIEFNQNTEFNPEVDLVVKNRPQKYTDIKELLQLTLDKGASDLHIASNYPPFIRIDDKLVPVGEILEPEDVKKLIYQILSTNQRELFEVNKEVDLSYQFEEKARFRINVYFEKGNIAAALRPIPTKIRSINDLGLPAILLDIANLSQGLFLVTGPTGSGKSTTLAAMIQHINETSPKHIVTIEDPIEYVYPRGTAIINQRELGTDTHDWNIAMKSALRQDPDVILIGELRDFETIQLAITLAETGHLVFSTLHTYSASQSIDRILDVFPPHQQQQIRTQLAGTLKGILSQRLVPMIGGGRAAAIELLIVTPAVQNLIREGKTYQIDNVIETSAESGMILMEKSLVKLIRQGKISTVIAQNYAIRPERITKMLKVQN